MELRILGDDTRTLQSLSRQAEAVLSATPGIRDTTNPLRTDTIDLALDVDEDKAALLGVQAGAAKRLARLALSGERVASLRDPRGEDYAVQVRAPMADRNDYAVLSRIYVPGAGDRAVPLSAIATPRLEASLPAIERFNRQRSVTLTAYVDPGLLVSDVTDSALARVRASVPLPPGYEFALGGEAGEQSDSEAGLLAAVLIAIFGIFAVLVLEFGSFRLVAVVAGIIPLGVLGALAALWLAGYSLSFTATIGVIALIGIEIKNSILLVDFTEQMRAAGMDIRLAIERAGEVRFLPVLLTSVTAIGGLLPLAIEGSGLYAPMAIAIIGGLVASTLLSRVATPVMYLLLVRSVVRPA